MHPFGDPRFPRRNLSDGALSLALSSCLIGITVSAVLGTHGSRLVYFIALLIYAALLGVAVAQFRLGLHSVAPDPPIE
jgi:hypothetical protein